jgi:Amino-terminal Zinc-binding domain of ubiquitin ligase E3A
MPDVDDVSSPSQQTSISTSPLMSPSDDREGFLCLSPTNKDPRPSASSAQTSKINSTNSANSTEISIHAAPRRRRSSNASSKLAAVPGNPLRQHGSDSLASNYRETGRGVANSVNSQQYPLMQYRQTKERSQSCHEEENRRVSAKQVDAQPDKSNKVDRTSYRQTTVQKATTTFSLRVKQFFYQIHSGCKNSDCHNRLCANGSHRGMFSIILFIYHLPVLNVELGNVTLTIFIIKIQL